MHSASSQHETGKGEYQRTPDMLLLGRSLLWAGRLLDVDDQLLLGLVLVDRAGWIVYFILDVEPTLTASAATGGVTEPI